MKKYLPCIIYPCVGLATMIILIIISLTITKKAQTPLADDRICVTKPGTSYYPGTHRCCGGLKSIFGSELPNGTCWCSDPNDKCVGQPTCAPCGNGVCETKYGEDSCNCKIDCR